MDELGRRELVRGRSPARSASCWSPTGPAAHGCVLHTVSPRYSSVTTGSTVARQAAMSAPVSSPPSAALKRSISSATKPSYHASRAFSISSSRDPPRLSSTIRRYVARERRVPEERAWLRRREVEVARAGPARDELLVELDRRADPLVERIAVLRVADCELEHVPEPPGAEVAEEEQPSAERARHAGREHAGARDRARGRARGTARSSPQTGRRLARRARAARRARPTRTRPAPRRRARSGAARRPAARSPSRRPHRTRCRRARARPSRSATRASASTRPSRRCRAARGA